MDAPKFLADFAHIASAPGGVGQLRELTIHLAVSGRLTDQMESEDASELLAEIQARRELLLGEGGIRINRRIHTEPATGGWAIPLNWRWCRFGELCSFSAGRTPSRKEAKYWNTGDYPWFSIADLEHGAVVRVSRETVSEEARQRVFKSAPSPAGSLLMSFKLTIGKLSVLGVDAYHNEAIITISAFSRALEDYFLKCLSGFDLGAGKKAAIKGSTLNQHSLSNILIALPPKAEIPRIVARVDQLMALCDSLEKQQRDSRNMQNDLRRSTLQAVAAASSPYELQAAWARLEGNFRRLFRSPEDVDDFVAGLKDLAVRGLLVKQSDRGPELDVIKADCSRARLGYIDAGLMRRQKPVGTSDGEVTYPKHWGLAAFDEVAVVMGGVTKGRNLRGKKSVTLPYLAVANVQRGYFKLNALKSIEIAVDELPKYVVYEGDLLITEGGDWDKVGRTAIWRGGLETCLHQNHVFKARIPSELLLNEWIELVFNSVVGRDYFAGASKQTTNLASINMTQLRRFPVPIPPEDEQRRILEKLGTLSALCVEWQQLLQRKTALASLLASAAVASLTGVTTERAEDERMKPPQTELIARLRIGAPPDARAQAPLATVLARHNGEMSARDLWQRFGGEVDAFYAQLKTEVAHGWILEPEVAEMREKPSEAAGA